MARRWAVTAALIALVAALALLPGCARRGITEAEAPVVEQAPGVLEGGGLAAYRAREIVAEATGASPADVVLVAKSAVEGVAEVVARVPADEHLLPPGESAEGGEPAERVTVRWNLRTARPIDILWGDRLQFAEEEPVTAREAEATAGEMKERWFPQVPATMVMADARKLHRPAWVIAWRGETDDGTATGDEVIVQVSSVTGLPIAHTQRVAAQRPSPEKIAVTRDEAIAAARQALKDGGWEGAESAQLTAQLTLSSPAHPEGGPAWLVRTPPGEGQRAVVVNAISGEVIDAGEVRAVVGGTS